MILFTKTFVNDLEWFELAALSVAHFCQELVEWHVACEDEHMQHLWSKINSVQARKPNKINWHADSCYIKWADSRAISNGYYRQQWIKMNAHILVGNNLCWNWDSDVIAQRPFDTSTLCSAPNKPIMWVSEMNHLIIGGYPTGRKDSLMEIFGGDCPYEYMRCMPIPMWGWILANGANQNVWFKSYNQLIQADPRFSEFNVMGEFAHRNFPEAFHFKNAETEGPTWAGGLREEGKSFAQFWSHGGVPQAVRELVQNL